MRLVYDDLPDSTAVEYSTVVENLRPDTDEVLAAALVDLGCTKKDAARIPERAFTRIALALAAAGGIKLLV